MTNCPACWKALGAFAGRGKVPVGWVSIGPREEYAKLKRSPVMKAADEQPVWSVVCFMSQVPDPSLEQTSTGCALRLVVHASLRAQPVPSAQRERWAY